MYDGEINLSEENNARTKIVRLIEPGSRVLEVGCATEFMTEYLSREHGCTVTAIEVDPEAAALAAARGVDVIVGSIEDAAVVEQLAGPYDVIIFSDVLEHLVDPEVALRATVPFLGHTGRLVASIPNVAHWSIRARLLAGRFNYTEGGILDRGHVRFFTRETIVAMFAATGLVPRFDCVNMFPAVAPLPSAVRRRIAGALPGLFAFQFIVDAQRTRA